MTISEMLINHDVTPNHFIASSLIQELAQDGSTVAIAEGCSGGNVLNSLTIPGSTRAFRLGCVAYSRDAKLLLGVPEEIIDTYGEYSQEVAIAMARAIRKPRNDSLAIATAGNLEPDPASKLSVVHFGYAKQDGTVAGKTFYLYPDKRHRIKSHISAIGLSLGLMLYKGYSIENITLDSLISPQTYEVSHAEFEEEASPILSRLASAKLKIATMESCTGGAIADLITNIPGASSVFDSGWVTYDENSKALLGVPLLTMANGNVYSERVAIAMAQAILGKTGVDIAISTTGAMDTIDRRPFHTDTLPGTVYIAISTRNGHTLSRKLSLRPGTRDEMKREVVRQVLQLLDQLIPSTHDSHIIFSDLS